MDDFTGTDLTPEQKNSLRVLMMAKRNDYRYLSRADVRRCLNCGEVFEVKGKGRPKKFCSAKCRLAYNHANPRPEKWKSTRLAVCPQCGETFYASREYGRRRKYCSHACANKARASERRKRREPDTER